MPSILQRTTVSTCGSGGAGYQPRCGLGLEYAHRLPFDQSTSEEFNCLAMPNLISVFTLNIGSAAT